MFRSVYSYVLKFTKTVLLKYIHQMAFLHRPLAWPWTTSIAEAAVLGIRAILLHQRTCCGIDFILIHINLLHNKSPSTATSVGGFYKGFQQLLGQVIRPFVCNDPVIRTHESRTEIHKLIFIRLNFALENTELFVYLLFWAYELRHE